WTRKEAVLKGFGMGISGLSARHETGFGVSSLSARFTPTEPTSRVDRWILWEAAPRPEFVAALAVDAGEPPLRGGDGAGPSPARCRRRRRHRRLTDGISRRVVEARVGSPPMEMVILALLVLFLYVCIRALSTFSAWMTGRRYLAYRNLAARYRGRYESRGLSD